MYESKHIKYVLHFQNSTFHIKSNSHERKLENQLLGDTPTMIEWHLNAILRVFAIQLGQLHAPSLKVDFPSSFCVNHFLHKNLKRKHDHLVF